MTKLWLPIILAAGVIFLGYVLLQGLRTGHIELRGLEGSRQNSPKMFWLVVAFTWFWFSGGVFLLIKWIIDPAIF